MTVQYNVCGDKAVSFNYYTVHICVADVYGQRASSQYTSNPPLSSILNPLKRYAGAGGEELNCLSLTKFTLHIKILEFSYPISPFTNIFYLARFGCTAGSFCLGLRGTLIL